MTGLLWDAHACPTLEPGCDLQKLHDYRAMGYAYVSLNAGFDPQAREHIEATMQHYRQYINDHADDFMLARTVQEVETAAAKNKLALGFDIEGLASFANMPEYAGLLKRLGVNQVTLAYNQNNALCGSCQDNDVGLTDLGRQWVAALNQAGILIDGSHLGKQSCLDIMAKSQQPIVFSHSNPKALHDHARNIDDELIQACADAGGVIGINGISLFLKNEQVSSQNIAEHVDYICQLVGIDHVGWGSDFVFEHEKALELVRKHPEDFPNAQQYLNVKVAPPDMLLKVCVLLLKMGYTETMLDQFRGGNFSRVAKQVWG